MNPPTSARLYIGVDGGGTHTRAIAIDEAGKVLGTGSSTGSNPNNIGYEKAANNILDAIEGTGVNLTEDTSICMGIAGLTSEEQHKKLKAELINALPQLGKATLHLTHDLDIAHHAAFQGKPGIVLIAGTGSACFARNTKGQTYRASGRDFDYEDPGSGYAIGKRAIDSKLLLAADSRPAVAALAPRVIELAAAGDLKALDIIRIEAKHLAKLAKQVFDAFVESEPFPILALSGSILKNESLYRYSVLFELQNALPGIKIIDTQKPPETAAAELAQK